MTLTEGNTYTGETTIRSGTLAISGKGAINSSSGVVLANSATFDISAIEGTSTSIGTLYGAYGTVALGEKTLLLYDNDNKGYGGVFTSTVATAKVDKQGSGVLTLSGDSSGFTGTFEQNAGTVVLNSSAKLGGSFAQNSGSLKTSHGATLGAATFKGNVTPTGTLKVASADFNGANVEFGALTDKIEATNGDITFLGGATTINVNASGASGQYDLMSATSGTLSGKDKIVLNATGLNPTDRAGFGITNVNTALTLSVINGNTNLTWAGTDATDSTWNNTASNKNWVNTTTGEFSFNFLNNDTVTFGNTGYKNVTVDPAGVQVANMTVDGTAGDYTVNVTAGTTPAIESAGGIVFNGSALNITGYTPGENIGPANAQTVLQAGTGTISGFDPTKVTVLGQSKVDFLTAEAKLSADDKKVEVDTVLTWNSVNPNRKAHGTFTIDSGKEFTLGANLANNNVGNYDTGWTGNSLTKKGGGTLILSGANGYSGGTIIEGGTLETTASFSTLRDTTIGAGHGTLNVAASTTTTLTHNGSLLGSGPLTKAGEGTLKLAGDASGFGGRFNHDAGAVNLAADIDLAAVQYNQTAGSLATGNNASIGAANFSGGATVTPTGILKLASATFNNATVDLKKLSDGNTVESSGAVSFAGTTTIKLDAGGAADS